MTNELLTFNYEMKNVRMILKDENPWFVAKDVCDVLGTATRDIKKLIDDDDVDTIHHIDITKRIQEMLVVNEAGLYSLILRSRKPEAKAFKRWITHEVIPSIRKHGAFLTDDVLAKTLDDPNYILGLITNLAEERNKRIAAEQIIELQTPKVEAYDSFLNGENTMTITEVGKIFGISGIKLYEFLRNQGVLLKMPYKAPAQEYLNKGYFKVILRRKHSNGSPVNVRQTRVTATGVEFIGNLLLSGMVA